MGNRSYILFIFILCFSENIFSQVGINTINPQAQLDVISLNPDSQKITDGILIPRIRNFPSQSLSVNQNGMIVFLEVDKTEFPAGFYYWNASENS